MAIKHRTPERESPLLSGVSLPKFSPETITLTTAGGAGTMTAAQALAGILRVDTQDAQTLTTPTATQLNDAIPGVAVGTSFSLLVINYGDTTLTIALGTGVTKVTVTSLSAVLTMVTAVSKRFTFVCTGVSGVSGASADAWVVYSEGSDAAAVA